MLYRILATLVYGLAVGIAAAGEYVERIGYATAQVPVKGDGIVVADRANASATARQLSATNVKIPSPTPASVAPNHAAPHILRLSRPQKMSLAECALFGRNPVATIYHRGNAIESRRRKPISACVYQP